MAIRTVILRRNLVCHDRRRCNDFELAVRPVIQQFNCSNSHMRRHPGAPLHLLRTEESDTLRSLSFRDPCSGSGCYMFDVDLPDPLFDQFALVGEDLDGDGEGGGYLNPISSRRVKSVALWLGGLRTGPDGRISKTRLAGSAPSCRMSRSMNETRSGASMDAADRLASIVRSPRAASCTACVMTHRSISVMRPYRSATGTNASGRMTSRSAGRARSPSRNSVSRIRQSVRNRCGRTTHRSR